MPVSTFARRKSKRQDSSDIEDEGPSRKTVKSDRDGQQGRRRVALEDDDQNDDEDEGRIDIDNFRDQPLGKSDAQKLQGIGRDWINMQQAVRQHWKVVGDVAVSIADTAEGEDAEKDLAALDRIMKNLIDTGVEMQSHEQTLNDIAQKIVQGDEIDDASAQYDQGVKARITEYAKKTTRQKYAKSEEYAHFKHNIYEVQFPEKALPPITDFIPKEDGDDSDDDEDLEVGGFTQAYTCPITLVALDSPVTSEICGHSFSAEAICQSFRGATVKCPAAGCNKEFSRAHLKPNQELAKKVKAWQRRAQRAAENIDAEEIID